MQVQGGGETGVSGRIVAAGGLEGGGGRFGVQGLAGPAGRELVQGPRGQPHQAGAGRAEQPLVAAGDHGVGVRERGRHQAERLGGVDDRPYRRVDRARSLQQGGDREDLPGAIGDLG